MPQKLNDFVVTGIHRGMADDTIIADTKMPLDQVRLMRNIDIDCIGYPTRRKGYGVVGSGAVVTGKRLLGLHQHFGTNDRLIAFANQSNDSTAEAYYLSGGTWTNKALAFAASTKIRAVSFLDYVIAVNGTTSPKSWTGAAGDSWGTTLLTSAPTGSLIAVFRNQVYIGNTSTDLVSFSSVPSGGSITWGASDNFFVNPNDGYNLTAFVPLAKEMLIFKRGYFYRFNIRSIDPDPFFAFGTPSQEAVAVQNGICYFYDSIRQGAFAYAGGYPQSISRAVQKYFKAVPTSSEVNVTAVVGRDYVEWHLGDITVSGVALTNVACRYYINLDAWTVRTYANEFTVGKQYDDGTNILSIQGSTDGFVMKMDSGNSDNTTAVSFELETQWYKLTPHGAFKTRFTNLATFIDKGTGISVQYKVDTDTSWRSIGTTKEYVTVFESINKDFHRIKFRFTGISDADPMIFEGFAMLEPLFLGRETE